MFDFLKPKRRRAEAVVTAVQRVFPHMCRITLGGAEVAAFLTAAGVDAPAAWVKVQLPSGDARAYTIRRIDRQAGTLDLEFALHGGNGVSGPASSWAGRARVGDRIVIVGPRDGGFRLPPDASWVILAGDATALPAIRCIAKALPAGLKAEIYAEVDAPDDREVIESPASLGIAWLGGQSTPGAALQRALADRPLPASPGYIWIAGESGAVRALRAHFLQTMGLAQNRVSAKGYWKVGETAHRDA